MKRALLAIAMFGCESAQPAKVEPAKPAVAPKTIAKTVEGLEPRFVALIRGAAIAYEKWGRVDERVRMGPEACADPSGNPDGEPSHVRVSAAEDGPHGRKLYYLWASDRSAYKANRAVVGFSIVKEAFKAVPAANAANAAKPARPDEYKAPAPIRIVEHEGKRLETGPAAGLFIMTKTDGEGTDAGWIYGTVSPDNTVTSAGRVESCMGCHEEAPHDRLFGLK